jgi:hypothetical protein
VRVSAPESILHFSHVVLRLLQQRLSDVRQPQFVGFRHALPVAVQLTLFQFHVGFECRRFIRRVAYVRNVYRRRTTQKIDLLGKDLRVL